MYATNYNNAWMPQMMNALFDQPQRAHHRTPAMNVIENDEQYTLEFAVPGKKKGDFDIRLTAEGNLAVKQQVKEDTGDTAQYLRREFTEAQLDKTFILPDDVDHDRIGARVADGVLTIRLPKIQAQPQPEARSIAIG